MPNAWDVGSAAVLGWLGFQALATTSSGHAATLGRLDGAVTPRGGVGPRDRAVARHRPAGLGRPRERVRRRARRRGRDDRAWRKADRSGRLLGRGLLRRAERPDLRAAGWPASGSSPPPRSPTRDRSGWCSPPGPRTSSGAARTSADTIARLQAYQEAGADVLFAPGLTSAQDIRHVVESVDRPVNVLARSPARRASPNWPRSGSRASRSVARSRSPRCRAARGGRGAARPAAPTATSSASRAGVRAASGRVSAESQPSSRGQALRRLRSGGRSTGSADRTCGASTPVGDEHRRQRPAQPALALQPHRHRLEHRVGHRPEVAQRLVGVLAHVEVDLGDRVEPGQRRTRRSAGRCRPHIRWRTGAARAARAGRRSRRPAAAGPRPDRDRTG